MIVFNAEQLATSILTSAIAQEARHIWVEPQREHLRVRVRGGDNIIIEAMHLPKDHAVPLVAQFKKLAGLNLSGSNAIQRGFPVFASVQGEVRLWTTTLPTLYGEKLIVWIDSEEELLPELRKPTNL